MRVVTWLFVIPMLFAACDPDGTDDTDVDTDTDTDTDTAGLDDDLDIVGTYLSFGDTHTITNETWTQAGSFDGTDYQSVFNIDSYDNTSQFLLAQNDVTNEYFPELFSRFDWSTNDDGDLVYCQSAFDAASLDDAAAEQADHTDLAGGCGGFSWSVLTQAR